MTLHRATLFHFSGILTFTIGLVTCGCTDAKSNAESPGKSEEYPSPEIGMALMDALPRIHHCWFEWIELEADGTTNLCYTGYTSDGASRMFCAVFTNRALARVVASPTNRVTITDNGSQRDPPDARISDVLASTKPIPLDAIRKLPPSATPPKQHVDWGLTAAYLLVQVVCTPIKWVIPHEDPPPMETLESYLERRARFDPLKIPLGGTREQCEMRLGAPILVFQEEPTRSIVVYGEHPRNSLYDNPCVVGIEYRRGLVARVMSRGLFDWDTVTAALNMKYRH